MATKVTVKNNGDTPVPVLDRLLLPGEWREVSLWAAEQAQQANPSLEVIGAEKPLPLDATMDEVPPEPAGKKGRK